MDGGGGPALELAGTFTCYAYCPCVQCCGEWSGLNLTASVTTPEEGRTIAADPSILPMGTVLYIDGHRYVVEDTGSGITGYKLDLYMESHEAALLFGVQEVQVWIETPERPHRSRGYL